MKGKDFIKQCLIRKQNKRYVKEVRRQHEDYDTWIRRMECEKTRADAKEEPESDRKPGVKPAEFVWMPSLDGTFSTEASKVVGTYFTKHSECMIIYADEDICERESGRRSEPWFKPDWSPDTFLSYDYLGNAVAVRSDFLDELGYQAENIVWKNRREILDSCIQKCGGFEPGCDAIGHIPQILFHGKSILESRKPYCEFFREESFQTPHQEQSVKISVIIPSKDNLSVLKQCILSVMQTTEKQNLEFVVVDNGSCQQTVEEIKKLKEDLTNVKYLYEPMEFNFSKMCNLGAEAAGGEYLLFLNDDTQAVEEGWLEKMLQKAERPYVGAVGMKLLYPDNERIQHAGVVNLPMGPVHKLQFLSDRREYYFDWNKRSHNVLAVTGACLMIKKARFEEAGGFDEDLKVAFNDVALCFQLYEMGYHNVVINEKFLYHHESLSRGNDESEEKWKRLMTEKEKLYHMFPRLQGKDPYYSDYLNRNGLDTRILPGNEDSRISPNPVAVKELRDEPQYNRQDQCLILRIERAEAGRIQGYAVVLGSNNACFEKKLILKRETFIGRDWGYGYETKLPPAYRSDLEENMPDQENVALCGFSICPKEKLAPGSYHIGVLAKDRISGKKIVNFSSRILRVTEEEKE